MWLSLVYPFDYVTVFNDVYAEGAEETFCPPEHLDSISIDQLMECT